MPEPDLPTEQRIKEIIADVFMRTPRDRSLTWDQIESDLPLYSIGEDGDSLGLDSLDAVEIATELEEVFDVVLPAEIDPVDVLTVRQVQSLLQRTLAEQREPGA